MVWREEKLGNLIKIKHGFAFKGEFFSDSGDFVLLTPGNIHPSGGIKLKGEKEKYYLGDFPNEYLMNKGELLVVMTDLTQEASILGGAMLIPESGRYLHNQRLGLISIKDSKALDKSFLYCYLNWQYFRDQVKASSNGATVKHTSPDRIYKCKIHLPPLPIQQKIAAILSAYDDLIENNNKHIALLEKAAEEIYREWFVRMRFPGWEQVKFVKGIPEGWEIVDVKSLGKIVTGKTPSTKIAKYYDGDYLFIKTPNMHGNMFVYETDETLTEDGLLSQPSQTIPEGSVCVSCIGTGGIVSITTSKCQTNQQINSLIPKNETDLEWAFYTLRYLKEMIQLFGATGATMTNLSKGKFAALKILKPEDKYRKSYHGLAKPMFSQIQALLQSNRLLKQSRDLILARLISGKLSVEALDIRFPPSMIAQ